MTTRVPASGPRVALLWCLLAAGIVAAGCAGNGGDAEEGGFAFYVRDKEPMMGFGQVWVGFAVVALVADEDIVEVWNGSAELDLRALNATQARALVGDGRAPLGNYSQVRIHIDAAWGINATTGERVDLRIPSRLLRINQDIEVGRNATTELLVDFDLDRSLVQAGDHVLFKPVLHRTVLKGPDGTDRVDEDPVVNGRRSERADGRGS